MIVFNDKKDKEADPKKNTTYDIIIGVIIALIHMTFAAFANFGQKLLCKEKMIPEVQNYYLGLFNLIPAFILMLIQRKTGISNIIFILYAFSNGFLFYLANYCVAEALNIMPMNEFVPINYVKIVFIFIFGFIVLGEHVFITDIVESALIVGFQVYNVCFPVKKPNTIKDEDIKTNFINSNNDK